MKKLPSDPLDLQARIFAALCDDLTDIGSGHSLGFERVEGVREIVRCSQGASASPTGPLGLRPEPQAGLGHSASVPLREDGE